MATRHILRLIPLLMVSAALSVAAVAQTPGQAPELAERVIEAYRGAGSYSSVIQYAAAHTEGRWRQSRKAEVYFAFDRASGTMKLDRPEVIVGSDGKSLLMVIRELDGRYLSSPLLRLPIDFDAMTDLLPALGEPAFPDMVLLLDDQPWQTLSGVSQPVMEEVAGEGGAPVLTVKGTMGAWALTIDPKTHLVAKARYEVDPAANGMPAGDSYVETFAIQVTARNQPVAAAALAIDTTGRTAAASLDELAGQPASASHAALTGQPAPPVELVMLGGGDYKLADEKAKVVILDFWATWCGPCVAAMPKLQEVADWAKAEGKDVAVYAVNLREDPATVQPFWTQHGFTIPVLLDATGSVANAYGVSGIPQTVVIADGKIVDIHVGYSPQIAETLKKQVDEALAGTP